MESQGVQPIHTKPAAICKNKRPYIAPTAIFIPLKQERRMSGCIKTWADSCKDDTGY